MLLNFHHCPDYRIPHLQHVALAGPIGPDQYIQPRTKLKVGVGENGEILQMEAFQHIPKLRPIFELLTR